MTVIIKLGYPMHALYGVLIVRVVVFLRHHLLSTLMVNCLGLHHFEQIVARLS